MSGYFGQFKERFTIVDVDSLIINSDVTFLEITNSGGSFNVGDYVTGVTSGTTGKIEEFISNDLVRISNIIGIFQNETVIKDGGGGTFDIENVDNKVINSGGELPINDPGHTYAESKFSFERSPEYRGFNTEYSDGELTIDFDRIKIEGAIYSPYSFIKSILDSYGWDAKLMFRAYRTPQGGVEEYREWKILLDSAVEVDYAYKCRLKRVYFNDKIRNRMSTAINVESEEDLDGNGNSSLALIDVPCHSRAIEQKTIADVSRLRTIDIPVTQDTTTIVTTACGNTTQSEIEGFNPLSYDVYGDVSGDIANNLKPLYTDIKYNGIMSMEINYVGVFFENTLASSNWEVTLTLILDVYRNNDLISSTILETQTASGTSSTPSESITYSDTYELNVVQGHSIFLYTKVEFSSDFGSYSGTASYEVQDFRLTNTFLSKNKPSIIKGSLIYDLLNKLVQKAIGDDSYNPVVSNLISNGGIAEYNFMTSGNKIRQIDKPIVADIENILEFIRVRYNAGFSFYESGGVQYMRVEQADYFFADVEIIDLGTNYSDLQIRSNKDLICNEIELGYNKFAEPNEDGSIDGFNTIRSYSLPVSSVNKKITLTTDVITDDAEIERMRRIDQLADESDDNDEELFAIKCNLYNESSPLSGYVNVSTNSSPLFIELEEFYFGDQIDSATMFYLFIDDDFYEFGINTVVYDANNNRTRLNLSSSSFALDTFSPYLGTFYFDVDIFIPETHIEYGEFSYLVDPNSAYNLHHAPSNILHQWFNYLGGMLDEKHFSEKVKLASRKNNVDFYFRGRDLSGNSLISESQDYTLLSLRNYNPTFLNHKEYEVTIQNLDYDEELKVILAALAGEYGASKDHGYISLTDFNGENVKFYPTSVGYEPKNEETVLVGWGKID